MNSNIDFDESILKGSIIKIKCDLSTTDSVLTNEEVIVLDDDDFIQTALNFLQIKNNEDSLSINDCSINATLLTPSNTDTLTNHDQEETNLIDLTNEFEVDLSNFFLINTNVDSEFDTQHQNKNNYFGNNKIKDELDFKMFNFSSIEEILIDDDNENCNLINLSPLNGNEDKDNEISSGIDSQFEFSDDTATTKKPHKTISCKYCSKSFSKLYNLNRHIFIHESKYGVANENGQFTVNKCPKCDRQILDKSNFVKHLKNCLGDSFKLFISNKSKQIKIEKKVTNREQNFYYCEICRKVFSKRFNYNRHWKTHFLSSDQNKIELHKCEKCRRRFVEKKQLETHIRKWHAMNLECQYCVDIGLKSIRFNEKFEYLKHLNIQHSIKFKFECQICLKQFQFLSQYVKHRSTHWRVDSVNTEQNSNLKICDICSKTFTKTFNLNRHKVSKHSK